MKKRDAGSIPVFNENTDSITYIDIIKDENKRTFTIELNAFNVLILIIKKKYSIGHNRYTPIKLLAPFVS